MPNILLLFFYPFIAAILFLLLSQLPSPIKIVKAHLRYIAIGFSLIPLCLLLINHFQEFGSEVNYAWIPPLSIHFHLRIDTLSILFLYLTCFVVTVSFLSTTEETFSTTFVILTLILQALLIGFFTARDLALFTVFWEAMLLPLYFAISLSGGPNRRSAATKFLIYMITGSALMVAAVLALFFAASSMNGIGNDIGTFNLDDLAKIAPTARHSTFIAAIFLLAFAVKTPLFPFHAWLPAAYTESSTPVTILLSGILSKAGIYGILRVSIGLFPALLQEWSPWLLALAITGVLYGALSACGQKNYKQLIAYSSFSHVNFILAGLFIWNTTAHTGAILQAINHGITITALFLVSGWLEQRIHTTTIGTYSGLAKPLPKLCWITLFFVLASVALPGTNNFIGELLILYGLMSLSIWLTSILGLSIILSVVYMLYWMQTTYFNKTQPNANTLFDIKGKELLIATSIILLILWIGIYPAPILKQIHQIVLQESIT